MIEEIATRLIPGYVATQSFPADDPPHQAPISSPPQLVPQVEPDTQETDQEAILNQSLAVEPPQSPVRDVTPTPAKPLNEDNNNDTRDRDEDTFMPPSSPPGPSPSPEPEAPLPVEEQAEDMSMDESEPEPEPEPVVTETYSHVLVPVSSPTSREQNDQPPTLVRTPRLRRRSSFSQLSSSPHDEFTATRAQPIPESPSTASIIAEREKELRIRGMGRERERERDRDRDMERDRGELDNTHEAAEVTPRDWVPGPWANRGSPSMPASRARGRASGRPRGRGRSNLQISPERPRPPPSADRDGPYDTHRNAPLRRSGELGNPNDTPLHNCPYSSSHSPTRRQYDDTQVTLGDNDTTDRMLSEYTNLGLEDDEAVLVGVMENLQSADLMLQSQAPYVPPTQSSYPSQSQSQHRPPDSQRSSGRGVPRGRGRVRAGPRGRGRDPYVTPRRGRGRESDGSSNGSNSQRSYHYSGSQRSHESDRSQRNRVSD